MAYLLPLPALWAARGWKVKIRDRERLEPPHATVLFRARAWRWDLRRGGFMDAVPDAKEVPRELVEFVIASLPVLQSQWDAMYPENPIAAQEPGDD